MKRLIVFLLLATSVGAQSQTPDVVPPVKHDSDSEVFVTPQFNSIPHSTKTAIQATLDDGITVQVLTVEDDKAPEIIRIKDAQGNVLITLHVDGSSTVGDKFKPDEAAKDFWKAMALVYPPVCKEVNKPKAKADKKRS